MCKNGKLFFCRGNVDFDRAGSSLQQSFLLGGPSLNIRHPQTAAVQCVGQVGEVAAQRFQLRQRLLALQSREPVRWQRPNHLEKENSSLVFNLHFILQVSDTDTQASALLRDE